MGGWVGGWVGVVVGGARLMCVVFFIGCGLIQVCTELSARLL